MHVKENIIADDNSPDDAENDQAENLRRLVEVNEKANIIEKHKSGSMKHDKRKNVNTRVITVTSGKGGVGKTSVSVNLALALVKLGKKVLLFDGDLGLANINVLLGIIPKFNLYHVVKGTKTLQEIIITLPEGLDIIAGASGYSVLANLDYNERGRILEEFGKLAGYDIMIIDTGAGVSTSVIGFVLPADEVIVLTTPEPTSITDAYGIIKSIVLVAPEKQIKLVVNRTVSALEARKVTERVINISGQFLNVKVENGGFIFDDENVGKAIRKQKPFMTLFPNSKASGCLRVLAGKLVNKPVEFDDSPGISGFFKKVFGDNSPK